MFKHIIQINEESFLLDFGSKIDIEINSKVNLLTNFILNNPEIIKNYYITNIIPSYNKIIINFDSLKIKKNKIFNLLNSIKISKNLNESHKKIIEIPICYDPPYSLDFLNIMEITNLKKNELINSHLKTLFHVYMIGFLPGLPFMGHNKDISILPRKITPRINIPKGSVGLVDNLCVIYPQNSPGGWNIIGRTPIEIFSKNNLKVVEIKAGDKIKFKRITSSEFKNYE